MTKRTARRERQAAWALALEEGRIVRTATVEYHFNAPATEQVTHTAYPTVARAQAALATAAAAGFNAMIARQE